MLRYIGPFVRCDMMLQTRAQPTYKLWPNPAAHPRILPLQKEKKPENLPKSPGTRRPPPRRLAAAVWSRYPPTPLRWDGVAGALSLPGVPPFARYPLEPPETQRLPVGCGLLPESGVPVPGDGRLATSRVCELGLRKREPCDPFTQIWGRFDSIILT